MAAAASIRSHISRFFEIANWFTHEAMVLFAHVSYVHVNIIAFIFAMFHSVMFRDSPVDTSVVSEIDNWFMNSAMVFMRALFNIVM